MAESAHYQNEVKKVMDIVRDGGVVIYPSDTLWALGCDATQDSATEKLIEIKGRSVEKGLIILIPSENDLLKYVREVPDLAYDLIEFAENPLTLVLNQGKNLSISVMKENQSIAVRVVKTGFCHDLLKALKKPLVSTSANLSGEKSPLSFSEISDLLKSKVDYIVDPAFGPKMSGQASTIIRLETNGTIEFIRR